LIEKRKLEEKISFISMEIAR
jgi:chromosome segregation ATPase